MAINKTAVFLASRFEEFSELRELIKRKVTDWPGKKLSAVDLNDGNVSHRPPLAECLGYVRRSEFMILLLGDTYGALAPRSDKSFTHLEYDEATRDGSNTRVLVFCIGNSYQNRRIAFSNEIQFASWQKQVEENHTLGFFDPEASTEEIAQSIFDRLLSALYEMHFGELSVDGDDSADLIDAISNDVAIDDSEISSMEEREAQVRGVSLVDDSAKFSNRLDALIQPLAVATFEHREEAQRAIDIGEYGIAIRHLKRALEYKPLDLMANYWLAQLYLALGNKKSCVEAIELAERAAHVAEHDGGKIRAAGAYMIAARAAHLSNQEGGGLHYASLAAELAPHYSRVHIEMARQYVLLGNKEEALRKVEDAFRLYPRSLREVIADPVFRPIRKSIEKIILKIKEQVFSDLQQILSSEEKLCRLVGKEYIPNLLDAQLSLSKLYENGRESVRRQHNLVKSVVGEALRLSDECSNQDQADASPVSKEAFRFNYPGASRIITWFKQAGDIIQPDEAICSFSFVNNSSVRNWQWKGRFPIRMTKRCVSEGELITPEIPYLFEYVQANTPVKLPSRIQSLRKQNLEAQEIIESASQDKSKFVQRLGKLEQAWTSPANILKISIPAVMVVIGLIAWAVGYPFILFIAICIAAFTISTPFSAWKEFQISKKRFENNISENEKILATTLNDISTNNAEIDRMLESCKEMQGIARSAINDFEQACLRRGARMLPFASAYGCHADDLIRVKDDQLPELKERMHRDVEVTEEIPEWLSRIGGDSKKSSFNLYRVVIIDKDRLTLSRLGAYR